MTDLASIRRRRRLVTSVCVALWAAAAVVSHVPSDDVPATGIGDLTAHVLGYFVMTAALWLSLSAHGWTRKARLIGSLVIAAGYGALDETTQQFFGRTPDLIDWAADMAGAAAAVVACELLARVREASGK